MKGEELDMSEKVLEDLLGVESKYFLAAASSDNDEDQVEITGKEQLPPPSPTLDHDDEMAGEPSSSSTTVRAAEQLPGSSPEQLPHKGSAADWYETN